MGLQRTMLVGLQRGLAQKRLVNAEALVSSQHSSALRRLTSPLHVLQSRVQCDFQGRALLLLSPKKLRIKLLEPSIAQMACIPELGSQGRAMFATGTPANFDLASVVSVIATWFWTFKPPGTDTLKSHLLSSGGKTNLITAFII